MTQRINHERPSALSEFAHRYHFFISYRGTDADLTFAIAKPLQEHGLRVYFDRDRGQWDKAPRWKEDTRGSPIPGGDKEIAYVLWNELSLSLVLLVVETDSYYQSIWGHQEFAFFFKQQRPMMIWHPKGDFWHAKPYDPQRCTFTREEFVALTGEVEYPFVIQHLPEPSSQVEKASSRANLFLELIEFAQWKGDSITCDNVEKYATMHMEYKIQAEKRQREIKTKYNRNLQITRTPEFDFMSSDRIEKFRPWVVRVVDHLELILNDAEYRRKVFRDLDELGISHTSFGPKKLLSRSAFKWPK